MVLGALTWAGQNARWILSLGCIAALFLPGISATLRPFLPALVSLVLAIAMARIDLVATASSALRPHRLLQLVGISVLLLPVAALIYAQVGRLFPAEVAASLIYLAAAPPIASAAGLCFLLGYNARLAIEVTVAATLLTPILGPLTVALVLPDAPPLSPLALAYNLGAMIFGGILLAILLRAAIGADRIARQAKAFDGVAALTMLLFVFPLFDQVGGIIFENPLRAVAILALATAFNLGINFATRTALAPRLSPTDNGAMGILMGNRTVALYLAALPFEPTFALFTALYQFPMYFTPLALSRLSLARP